MILTAGNLDGEAGRAFEALREAHMVRHKTRSFDGALTHVEWDGPLVLVTDLEFEGGDAGGRLIEEIRSIDKHPYRRTKILALSQSTSRKDVVALLEAGASDILLAPWKESVLRIRARWLDRKPNRPNETTQEEWDTLPEQVSQADIDHIIYPEEALTGPDPYEAIQARQEKRQNQDEDRKTRKHLAITYDFRHPSRVSKDQMRTLENLHNNFARMVASTFSRAQQSIVDCDIAFVDQTTYGEFIEYLSNPAVSYTFTVEPLHGPVVIDFGLPVTYDFVTRAFGGDRPMLPFERRPTTRIERGVMNPIITQVLADLEATWAPLLKFRVSDAEMESNPEFMQIAAPSDTVILIAMEINSARSSGMLTLCYPYFTLEPGMELLNVQNWASRGTRRKVSAQQRQDRLDGLKGIEVDLTTVLARTKMSADALNAAQVGDILPLGSLEDQATSVHLDGDPLFVGTAGVSPRGRHAVRVERAVKPSEKSRYFHS